nr:ATP synthase F0 subunit 8 [Aviostivalius klossi bispiniformis]
MPQMSPLYWLILFILFLFMYLLFMIKNYFMVINKISNKNKSLKSFINNKNWKW